MNNDDQRSETLFPQETSPAPVDTREDVSSTNSSSALPEAVEKQQGKVRHQYRWSKAARDLVRANLKAEGKELSALLNRLMEKSGNPRWACRRFATSMGVGWRRSQRPWTTRERQHLLKLLDLHPVSEIARIMRRSQSAVFHMLYRLGANAKMGNDSFTKYTLAVALHVEPRTIENWISRGLLKAHERQCGQTTRVIVEAGDFCEFCRKHTREVVGNRLKKERLDFVYHFAFPPSHAELLPVRDSMKERKAYDAQTRAENSNDTSAAECVSEDGDDELDRTA